MAYALNGPGSSWLVAGTAFFVSAAAGTFAMIKTTGGNASSSNNLSHLSKKMLYEAENDDESDEPYE